jgi:hypothetical protein
MRKDGIRMKRRKMRGVIIPPRVRLAGRGLPALTLSASLAIVESVGFIIAASTREIDF